MKKNILVLLVLYSCGIASCFGQYHYDRVTIYAIPINTSFAGDNINADYVRAHATFEFTSSNKDYIESVSKLFLVKNKDYPCYAPGDVISTIRVVIDFIDNEKIESFVLINSAYDIFISKDFNDYYYYSLSDRELCKIKKVVPFFDYLTFKILNCK